MIGRVFVVQHDEIIVAFPEQTRNARSPLALGVNVPHQGVMHEIGLVPDIVFGPSFYRTGPATAPGTRRRLI